MGDAVVLIYHTIGVVSPSANTYQYHTIGVVSPSANTSTNAYQCWTAMKDSSWVAYWLQRANWIHIASWCMHRLSWVSWAFMHCWVLVGRVSIGLIMNCLLSRSIKHAFQAIHYPSIGLHLTALCCIGQHCINCIGVWWIGFDCIPFSNDPALHGSLGICAFT